MMLWGDVVCDVVWGGMIDLKLFGGFAFRLTDGRTDIGCCRVAFATENSPFKSKKIQILCQNYLISAFY